MHVSIIDDSLPITALVAALITELKHECSQFHTVAAFLGVAKQVQPDLLIVDLHLPDLNGFRLMEYLQSDPALSRIPVIMITGDSSSEVRYQALDRGVSDFLAKPIDPVEVKLRVRNLLRLRAAQSAVEKQAKSLRKDVEIATRNIVQREEEIILRLSRASEHRDTETGEHIVRVARYSELLAQQLGLGEAECRIVYLASPMHDIGKLAVPDAILQKPDRYTNAERQIMQMHAEHGARILGDSQSELIQAAQIIAVTHHEKWDGSGYPNGLKGEQIPLFGRIVALADVFDALTSPRVYKRAWALIDAKRFIEEQSGLHFDPVCVEAFFTRWDNIVEIYHRYGDKRVPEFEQNVA